MRSRRTVQDEMAAIAQRRLELLTAELAGVRGALSERPGAAGEAAIGRGGAQQAAPVSPRQGASSLPPGPEPWASSPTPEDSPAAPETEAAPTWESGPATRGRHARRPLSAPGRLGGWVHDRLPPTLQGRVRLTAGHLSVVALLVAAAFAVTAWWAVRADGSATVVPAATWSDPATDAPGTSPAPLVTPVADPSATADTGVVVVDVEGKVRRPGIATLPVGSRVVDALEAAGGVRPGVDVTALNLARVLVDGEQIIVGIKPAGGVAAPAASAPGGPAAGGGSLVNINAATQTDLEELPGVGPVTAAAIVQWRTDNGPFTAVDELLEVSGIGDATLAKIAPFVTL